RGRHPLRAALGAHAAAAPAAAEPVAEAPAAAPMPPAVDALAAVVVRDADAATATEPAVAAPVAAVVADRPSSVSRALKAALAAYAREDYLDAAPKLTSLARAGDPEAQYRLGLLYGRGKGVLGNLGDAIVWYRRAAEQGHAEAQHQLSLAYLHGGHAHYEVGRWYDAAAEIDKNAADNNL